MKQSLTIVFLLGGCSPASEANLSPASWPEGELQKYTAMSEFASQLKTLAEADTAMITGTTSPLAIRAGLEALKQGGSAVDAALTTALAQIALVAGSYVSYGGMMNMIYRDAGDGTVHTMNAMFSTVKNESDPASIPACSMASGRTAFVPGFFAGVQAAHDRFGKLPFATLFEPALFFADSGFAVPAFLARFIDSRKEVLGRLPATKGVFTRENGEFYGEGDWFTQPELANTLRNVAAQGAEYIYRGDWARHFVEAVRNDGGKMTLDDLAAYEVIWGEPIRTTYRGYDILGTGPPNFGGTKTLEAMNVLEHVGIPSSPPYWESADVLFWITEASRLSRLMGPPGGGVGIPASWLTGKYPEIDLSYSARIRKETAEFWWDLMQTPAWDTLKREAAAERERAQARFAEAASGGHSDAVVAVDRDGNVVALTHTINTRLWGGTGILVDGISIPDAACFQQDLISRVGPGVRLPDPTNPVLVTKDGEFVLAGSSVGSGLHLSTLLVLVNILDYGNDPQAALDAPQFTAPFLLPTQSYPEDDFSQDVIDGLRSRGLAAELVPKAQVQFGFGWWINITRDPETGVLSGGTPQIYNGLAKGF